MKASQYGAYAAPSVVLSFLYSPMGIVQGIYAKHFGLAMTTIATVLLISRLFDAVTDPLIGHWSDYHHSKSGSRKPFVIAGGLLFGISSYFLYVPIDPLQLNASTNVSTTYFLAWFLMFYLAWTLVEIPHLAWGSELVTRAKDKNKLYSLRALSTYLGILLFYLVPFLPVFSDSSFTPKTLQWAAVAAGLLLLPTLYLCAKLTPDGTHIAKQRFKQHGLWVFRKEILANKPFLFFIAAFVLYGMGAVGMFFTLMFIFIDTYLGLGKHFALLSIIGICCGLLSISFWYWLSNYLGKKAAWSLGVLSYLIGVLSAVFLEPGEASLALVATIIILAYVGSTPVVSISPSLLADIIDFSTWKFGTDRAATYFSIYTLVLKTSTAIGGSIGFGLAGWYGFDPSSAAHTKEAIYGLRLATCWLPAMLMLCSIFIMALVPINTYRHNIIRRRLNASPGLQPKICKSRITENLPTLKGTAQLASDNSGK